MKKDLSRLNKEAEVCNYDNFVSQLIDGCNNLGEKRTPEEALKEFDRRMGQVYKKDRIYLVMEMHNASKKGIKGVAYTGTANILFGRLCHLWYGY